MAAYTQRRKVLELSRLQMLIASILIAVLGGVYAVHRYNVLDSTPISTESVAIADARLLNPEPEEFVVAVGLTASGSLSPTCVDLMPGLFYEVLVPESRRDSYYIRPKGADATVITTWDGWKEKLVASEDEMLRDKGNHLLFREDGATYTEVKVFAADHRPRAKGYLRINFKVVPDERFPADRDQIVNGRPLRDGE